MLESCSKSTRKQYESALQKWRLFCQDKNLDVFNASINSILAFLTHMHKQGLGYSSINTIRSAISLVLPPVDGFQTGSHPLVIRFLKGISNLKPPRRKYNTVWDAGLILDVFRSWPSNEQLDLKRLSLKVCGLLAILSGQRAQTLAAIKVSNIICEGSQLNILIDSTIKTSRPGAFQPNIYLPCYPLEPKVCPVLTVNEYKSRTSELRNDNMFFVSYTKPHKSLTSQSISRWLKELLEMSGVDTTMYKGHSFRHASTSSAFEKGVSIDVIFASAGWSTRSKVFANFYKCKIDNREDYAKKILG